MGTPYRSRFGFSPVVALILPALLVLTAAAPLAAQQRDAGERPIRWLMSDFERAMNAINEGLWREDMQTVEEAAASIADHPGILPVEVDSLQEALGPNWSAFQRYDSTMRARAEALGQAARRGQTGTVVREYGALQETCTTCHTAFRGRVQEVLYGRALAAHEAGGRQRGAAGETTTTPDREPAQEAADEGGEEPAAPEAAEAAPEETGEAGGGPEEPEPEADAPESTGGEPVPESPTEAYTRTISGTLVEYEMRPVPGGSVTVETESGSSEKTVEPRWMSTAEVTWPAYDIFVYGLDDEQVVSADAVTRPSKPYVQPGEGFGHDGYPAVGMTAQAAQNYAQWLSEKTGRSYRLPTEAEWEHACRESMPFDPADTDSLDRYAWYEANADGETHPVGSKPAGRLGLHDVLGNAAEWVVGADGEPVLKGGAFNSPAGEVSCEARMEPRSMHWKRSDPQIPKSEWWFTDAPFVTIRLVRVPEE